MILQRPRVYAEANLPASYDDSQIGDEYLKTIARRPYDWRLRVPSLQPVLEENMLLNQNMDFSCDSLNSFAAFSGFGAFADTVDEVDAQEAMNESDSQSYQGQSAASQAEYNAYWAADAAAQGKPVVSRAPGSTGNNAIDVLSGLLKDVTPAATNYVAGQLGLNKKPATAPAAARPAAASSSNLPMIILAVAVVGGVLFLTNK